MTMILTGCNDHTEEAQIAADASIAVSANEASATIGAANAAADARKVEAAEGSKAAIAVAQAEADARKFESKEATTRTGMTVAVAPTIAVILAVVILGSIVLWFRGKAHIIQVSQLQLTAQPSHFSLAAPAPPKQIPVAVRKRAELLGAEVVPASEPDAWELRRDGEYLLTMRPRQLTDTIRQA
jgi:hypothetical protein